MDAARYRDCIPLNLNDPDLNSPACAEVELLGEAETAADLGPLHFVPCPGGVCCPLCLEPIVPPLPVCPPILDEHTHGASH